MAATVVAAVTATIGIARGPQRRPAKAHQATVVGASSGQATQTSRRRRGRSPPLSDLLAHQLRGDARPHHSRPGRRTNRAAQPLSSRAPASTEEPECCASSDAPADVDGELLRQLDELIACVQRVELGAVDELSASDQRESAASTQRTQSTQPAFGQNGTLGPGRGAPGTQ